MKNLVLILLVSSILVAACTERETVSGQKFTIAKKGDGKEVSDNNYLLLNMIFKDAKDSVWYDSRKNPYPSILLKKLITKPGDPLLEVVCMLTKGDSAVMKMNAYEVFTKSFHQPVLPPKVDSASVFTFCLGLTDVLDSARFIKFQEEAVAKQNAMMLKQQNEQLAKDTVIIDNLLKSKNIVAKRTASGIRYVVNAPGLGETGKDGQTASVNYSGYLIDGKCFDTNIEAISRKQNLYQQGRVYGPYPVILGRHSVIQGWEDMLKIMRKGTKVTAYIPSTLAYGNRRYGPVIGENAVLVFDMELVDLK